MQVLVSGSCGSVGTALVRHLLQTSKDCYVIGIDNNESGLFVQEQEYLSNERARFAVGDIRDYTRLVELMQGVDLVFHAAALKHVLSCERAPMDTVQTNIMGVNNIVCAARVAGVKKVIFASSDKAVNPTNVMGTSKLMGERLITAANAGQNGAGPVFSSTRFGNVLGSSGSVGQVFRKQIASGGPVTLTDPEMTRFVMTVQEAARVLVDSAEIARGGEVFIMKMPVIRIIDLAKVMIEELAPSFGRDPSSIEIRTVGVKPGEKLYEELMNGEEMRRAIELPKYFAIPPAFRGIYCQIDYDYVDAINVPVTSPYVSANQAPMPADRLRDFILESGLLEGGASGAGQ